MIRAKVKNPNVEVIRSLPYVGKVEAKDGNVTIILSEVGAHIQEVLCNLGEASFVELREPTLNDVFLQLTGRGIREESAESWEEKLIQVRTNE